MIWVKRIALAILLIIVLLIVWMNWPVDRSPGEILRTPDERFAGLQDYPFQPNYMQIGDYRVHYLDEGPADADPILLIHGEPTWSYLFRKMIPVFTAAGHRVIVPDLIGFGKSDKASNEMAYTYQMQVDSQIELVRKLDLKNATFFGQDWGGLIGLRVVAAEPDRFARVVVSNTALPGASGLASWIAYPMFKFMVWRTGAISFEELRSNVTFPRWVAYSYHIEDLPIGQVMGFLGGTPAAAAAYQAPFPDKRYKAAAQIMPYLVPSQLSVNEQAWSVFEAWDKPFLVAFTDSDPITRGGEQAFIGRVPTAQNVTIKGAGHFVQEDAGPGLAALMNDFIAGRPVSGFSVSESYANTGTALPDAN
ncbi:MAG: haloalkane dehalogenase [Pseudomonadota bacterium]